jgi:hypothetical protein
MLFGLNHFQVFLHIFHTYLEYLNSIGPRQLESLVFRIRELNGRLYKMSNNRPEFVTSNNSKYP